MILFSSLFPAFSGRESTCVPRVVIYLFAIHFLRAALSLVPRRIRRVSARVGVFGKIEPVEMVFQDLMAGGESENWAVAVYFYQHLSGPFSKYAHQFWSLESSSFVILKIDFIAILFSWC